MNGLLQDSEPPALSEAHSEVIFATFESGSIRQRLTADITMDALLQVL